jgi:hypothetical protein
MSFRQLFYEVIKYWKGKKKKKKADEFSSMFEVLQIIFWQPQVWIGGTITGAGILYKSCFLEHPG